MTTYIFDIETFSNVFTMYIGNADTRECWGFEISDRKDQREAMFSFLRGLVKEKARMVGFNNLHFDYPVLHYILKNQKCTVKQIFNKAMRVIESEDKFEHIVPTNKQFIPQIDLYKIHHFDNVARATSLKVLEFNMRSNNIEDLPFTPGNKLSGDEIDELLVYNKHDMYQTYLFYMESLDHIRFREELTNKYNRNFMNHNDTKIGKDYFIMKLEESNPGCCYGPNRQIKQTPRDKIALKDCIVPYIHFERPEFKAVHEWLNKQVIRETKGVFTDILESDLGELAKYAKMRKKNKKLPGQPTYAEAQEMRKQNPSIWFEERELKSGKFSWYMCWRVADNLNTIVDGLEYDFGTGGIHASVESTVIDSDDEQVVVDRDVASFYPNLAIVNRLYPEHLGEHFCDIYQDVYLQRKNYTKGTAENAMMKLALNGVYGDSNNKFSPFYDPQYTMSITISGQLSLCMLAEQLLRVDGLKMIQLNTDGLTYSVSRENKEKADAICNEWEKTTGLELEEAIYSRMAIRDVNNYLAIDTDGKIKQKGSYQSRDMGWHQNQSALVIPMAAEQALLYDKDVEDFIYGHDNIYDFMYRTKVPRTSRLVGVDGDTEIMLQNTCRYYISNEGVQLVKIMPPLPDKEEERRIGINTGKKVTPCNNIKEYKGNINYQHYIDEANKIVKPLTVR